MESRNLPSRGVIHGQRTRPEFPGGIVTVVLGALGLVLSSCDEDAARPYSSGPPSGSPTELIPLRLKRIPRTGIERLRDEPRGTSELRLPASGPTSSVDALAARPDAAADWPTEVLAQGVVEQLSALVTPMEQAALRDLVADEFRCGPLRPEGSMIWRRGSLTVYRARAGSPRTPAGATFRGAAGLASALGELTQSFAAATASTRFKVTGIELTDDSEFTTQVRVETSGSLPGSRARKQANATWTCRWKRDSDGGNHATVHPRLVGIHVDDYAEAVFDPGDDRDSGLFADVTAAAFRSDPSFGRQQLRGIEYWSKRITRLGDLALTGHHGLAVGDVNADGLEDLYVCDGGSLPNRLFLQNPDGTARDVSRPSGVDWLEDTRSALLVDLDGDGDQDLVVATIAVVAFAENDGAGRFTLRGGHTGAAYPFSLSAADHDVDGDLDVYVCVYSGRRSASGARGFESRSPTPFHDARNGGRNLLLENRGAFAFVDVTAATGLDDTRWSFAAAWEDYDQDGDPDLYVANDFGRNQLYRNDTTPDGERAFVDVAATAGVEDTAAGMSVAWGDYNRDGRMDLYVGNMYSAAGNRVAYQRNFSAARGASTTNNLRRMARGNSLFAADGRSGAFVDVSVEAGVTMGRWAWSSAFADLNNDGWEDIVVTNGYLTNARDVDL